MIAQIFLPDGHPYKIYESPHTNASILLFCDVNADKVHTLVDSPDRIKSCIKIS